MDKFTRSNNNLMVEIFFYQLNQMNLKYLLQKFVLIYIDR